MGGGPDREPGSELGHPDVDEAVFDALADRERRFVCYYLLEVGAASVEELADVVAGWTAATAGELATPAVRERALVDLHHRNLPVLEAAGLVETDDAGTVTLVADSNARAVASWARRREGTLIDPGEAREDAGR